MIKLKIKKLISAISCWEYLRAAIRYRVFPSIEHDFLWKLNFKTIVDIGANRGQFSLTAKRNLKDINVYAFEPIKKAFNIYKSIFKNCDNIHIFNIAIGPEKKESIMNISNSEDSSSLLEISELQNDLFPNTDKKDIEVINENNLESHVCKSKLITPALLKIDVQGYEKEVINGCISVLENFSYIYCECSYVPLYKDQPLSSDIIKLLENRGYEVDGIYNTSYDKCGFAIQSDILFKKNR